jgi:hypothetical protein
MTAPSILRLDASAVAADGELSRETARDLARRELSRPEYHQDDPSFLQQIIERVQEWIESFIDSFALGGPGGDVSWIILVVLAVLLAAIVAFIWWRVGGVQRSRSRRAALLGDQISSATDHRAAAERHAAAQEWAEAIRERLRAIARDLEERAVLDPRPGRTADEMAAEATAVLPDHAAELRAAAQLFDEVWYGDRTATAAGYQRLTALDERLREARPAPIQMATVGEPT